MSEKLKLMASKFEAAFFWALRNVICRYRRSTLGPFWETLSAFVLIAGVTVVFTSVFSGSNGFALVPYIGLGIIFWSVLTNFFIDGTTVIIDNSHIVKNSNINIQFLALRKVIEILIVFLHVSLLVPLAVLAGLLEIHLSWLLVVPNLLLISIIGYNVVIILGLACARYRDLIMITRNFIQLMFFVTPIFWDPSNISSDRVFIIDYNPFYHMLEILRGPILGKSTELLNYYWIFGVLIMSECLKTISLKTMKKNIAMVV